MINTTRHNPMESGRISKCLFNGGYVSFSMQDVPRFLKQDMMAEKYYNVSPYMYCVGNSVNRVDPDGMTDYRINDQGYIYEYTSLWEKIKSILGYSNNSDMIFNESTGKLLVSCEKGSIKNLQTKTATRENGENVKETSFEYSGNKAEYV